MDLTLLTYVFRLFKHRIWGSKNRNEAIQSLCRCYTEHDAKRLEMSPLIAASFHNQTCPPLCGLPEELLMDIMDSLLDPVSFECFRQTSRIFARISCSPAFNTYRNRRKRRKPFGQSRWALHAMLKQGQTEHICFSCRSINIREDERDHHPTGLHCSACKTHHHPWLFTPIQRQSPKQHRKCVGHEGHARLCSHHTVTWETVSAIRRQFSGLKPNCEATIRVATCDHSSHLPIQHEPGSLSENKREETWPFIELQGNQMRHSVMIMGWTGHLQLPEPHRSGAFSYDRMAEALFEFRNGVAEFIAPQTTPKYLTESTAFNPSQSFLHYGGIEHLSRGWPSPSLVAPDPFYSLHPSQPTNTSLLPHPEPASEDCSQKLVTDITYGDHCHQDGRRCSMTFEACPIDAQCVTITYRRFIRVDGHRLETQPPTTSQESLDPLSYGRLGDKETRGVLWCDDPKCLNHHRYIARPYPVRRLYHENERLPFLCKGKKKCKDVT